MYVTCASHQDALSLFASMPKTDAVSFNAVVSSYQQCGHTLHALATFQDIYQQGILPNRASFLIALSACKNFVYISDGQCLHYCVMLESMESNVTVATALLSMYGRCQSMDDAWDVFWKLLDRDIIAWNAMISACAQNGYCQEGLELFGLLRMEGFLPNRASFLTLLEICGSFSGLRGGKRAHSCLLFEIFFSEALKLSSAFNKCCRKMLMEAFIPNRATFLAVITSLAMDIPSLAVAKYLHAYCIGTELTRDVMMVTALVSMYGKCGFVEEAWTLMDSLTEQDLVLYNAMIAVFSQNGHTEDALKLLWLLQMKGMTPDKGTFVSIIDACSDQTTIFEGRRVHAFIRELGLQSDPMMGNALLSMYGKHVKLEDAQEVFETITTRDVTTWNAMINALGQCGDLSNAVCKFEEMQTEGVIPDKFTFAGLFCACGNKQALQEGSHLHARIVGGSFNEEVGVLNALISMYGKCNDIHNARRAFGRISNPDSVSWNALIGACLRCGENEEAFVLCQSMQNVTTDQVTLISVSSAFASQSFLAEGWLLHACIVDMGLQSELSVCNALVHMYGKCGSLEDARHVFERMEVNDVISWNAIIAAYGQHGQANGAFCLLHMMLSKSLVPDIVTLISILTACSHAGRAGQLYELESMIKFMPMDPTAVSWMTLLGACNKHLDLERGVHAASRLFDLHPQECASFVLLSNLHASAGRWDDTKVAHQFSSSRVMP
ncbi:hypothetical protein GOP47_0017639 [Adiantum capillus-veneris]|uniref:Pentatricopeptide repeat-containing protein n=1 Tax=Adiantum capillus-veneris TaxID=13818 RepID=A0A9D4UGX7_ADICA|nr:hypothetical protein GOP47_0017639 [Adiantum capillus-veneris]